MKFDKPLFIDKNTPGVQAGEEIVFSNAKITTEQELSPYIGTGENDGHSKEYDNPVWSWNGSVELPKSKRPKIIDIVEDYSPALIAIGAFILGWFGHVIYSM